MSAQTRPLRVVPQLCSPALRPKLDPSEARELAVVFKALADPARVQMVSLLLGADEKGVCVCDIGMNFPLGQSTVSHHLKILRDAGLLRARKGGLWVFYSVNRERLAHMGIALTVPVEVV
ncbi:MAG: transcriptional regulator, ArsR family [Dehalococcoidia bacterium]|nr:transcriptional regulator, ArsR family [Dehalococcoidia bacterium]